MKDFEGSPAPGAEPQGENLTGSEHTGQGASRYTSVQALRIVVVDDNVDAALTMCALLTLQGHDVRTAHDGAKALDEIGAFQPDVAILDIGMPGMNGYTVARRIRERLTESPPLLIAVTGWGQDEDRRRSRAAGFDHHLVKPVDPAVLMSLLRVRPSRHTVH